MSTVKEQNCLLALKELEAFSGISSFKEKAATWLRPATRRYIMQTEKVGIRFANKMVERYLATQ